MDSLPPDLEASVDALTDLVSAHGPLLTLTGAGVSTESGIPDYRDDTGSWKRKPPVFLAEFVGQETARRRYWARSFVGWPTFSAAQPNAAHQALARLEHVGALPHLVTQNVDGLHQRAGSRDVLDLHGRLDEVECLSCGAREGRAIVQSRLEEEHPAFVGRRAPAAPDGDADLEGELLATFRAPECPLCGGIVKPSVVFFGESVPPARVANAYALVERAGALLVVGSSLQVFSGLRFVRGAAERGIPVAILNRGATRADPLATIRIQAPCAPVLEALADRLTAPSRLATPTSAD